MAKKKKPDEDEPKNENLNNDSDDSFGLPEIEYEPLQKKEIPEEPVEPEPEVTQEPDSEVEQEESVIASTYEGEESQYNEESQPVEDEETYQYKPYEEEPSIWPKVAGIVLVVVLALATAWFFLMYQPQQKEASEKARIEEERKAIEKQKVADAKKLQDKIDAENKRKQDSIEAANKTPAVGTVQTLNERTGRYYVVIASALDKDLLMDYAKKLSVKGVSSEIIPPFGKHKVSRLTIAKGDTFATAQAKAEDLKGEHGSAIWVLKY